MGYSMKREPRTIPPGGDSTITIEINDNYNPLKDMEVKFSVSPKEAGKVKPVKIKTDEDGCAKSTFTADPNSKKDCDVIVDASWKQDENKKNCKMLIEVRKNAKI
jgi:hypothetical protein